METLSKIVLVSCWLGLTTLGGVYAGKHFEDYLWKKDMSRIEQIENLEKKKSELKSHIERYENMYGCLVRNVIFGGGGGLLGLGLGASIVCMALGKGGGNGDGDSCNNYDDGSGWSRTSGESPLGLG